MGEVSREMMGIKTRQFESLERISLEELVPKDSFYRQLEQKLDLSFVRELVAPLYAPRWTLRSFSNYSSRSFSRI